MPAGDLVVSNYQVEVRGLLMGANTVYGIGPRPAVIEGLGVPSAKTADVELQHTHGSYAANDYRGARVITVPIVIRATTSTAAMSSLSSLITAWDVATADLPLYMRLPGWNKFYVNGRPRGCEADLERVQFGSIRVLCVFHALNPLITYV